MTAGCQRYRTLSLPRNGIILTGVGANGPPASPDPEKEMPRVPRVRMDGAPDTTSSIKRVEHVRGDMTRVSGRAD